MNRLAQQLIRDGHLTFRQKLRSLFMQIFGHEAYVDVKNMATTSHCSFLNEDVYRMAILDFDQLAKRKLGNPFKWIEFLLVTPPEMVLWWFHRGSLITRFWAGDLVNWGNRIHQSELRKYHTVTFKAKAAVKLAYLLDKLEDGYHLLSKFIISPLLHPVVNIATGIVRRPLAPVRYIIRPSIEMAQNYPAIFIAMGIATYAAITYFPSFVFLTDSLSLAVSGFLLGGTLLSQIVTGTVVWALLLKTAYLLNEAYDAIQTYRVGVKLYEKDGLNEEICMQPVKQLKSGSTEIITALLHAINPKTTEVRLIEKQGVGYSLALFTGTESFFYPQKSGHAIHCEIEEIPHATLRSYAKKANARRRAL